MGIFDRTKINTENKFDQTSSSATAGNDSTILSGRFQGNVNVTDRGVVEAARQIALDGLERSQDVTQSALDTSRAALAKVSEASRSETTQLAGSSLR